jgi:uncharacterized integral membrane protein
MKIVYTIFVIVVAVFAVVFAAQNNTSVQVNFLGWSTTGLLSIVLVITLAIGLIVGIVIMLPTALKHRQNTAKLKKRVASLEKEKNQSFAGGAGGAGTTGGAGSANEAATSSADNGSKAESTEKSGKPEA